MSDEFNRILRVEFGGHSFPAESVIVRDTPTRNEAGSLVRYERRVTVRGRVWGGSANEVIEKARALFTATFGDARPLRVIAMDGTLTHWLEPSTILAEGGSGPFTGELTFLDVTPTYCQFELPFVATWRYPGGSTIPLTTRHEEQEAIETRTMEDGRAYVVRSGRLQGAGASAALPAKLPAPSAHQTYTYNTIQNEHDTDVQYRIEIRPLRIALPAGCQDGEATVEAVMDGVSRTTRVSGHYVGPGALAAVEQVARDHGPGGTRDALTQRIVRTIHGQERVDFVGEYLQPGNDAVGVVGWSERVRVSYPTPRVVAREYPGIGPLLVYQEDVPAYVEHTGMAVHLDEFGNVPPPILDGEYPLADSETEREWVDAQRRRTSWRYLHVIADAPPLGLLPEGPR